MRRERNRIEEIKQAWARESDEELVRAVREDWDGYSSEAQLVIKEEVLRRKLSVAVGPIHVRTNADVHGHADLERALAFLLPLLLIGSIDLGLWRYYEWRDARVIQEMENARRFLETEKAWIETTEAALESNNEEIHKIVGQAAARRNAESISGTMSPDAVIQEYRRLYSDYETRLAKYNERVREYNSLTGKRYSRWYLIPIPVKTGGSR